MTLGREFKETFEVCPVCATWSRKESRSSSGRDGHGDSGGRRPGGVSEVQREALSGGYGKRLFERVRAKLERGETDGLARVGNAYEVRGRRWAKRTRTRPVYTVAHSAGCGRIDLPQP